MTTSDNSKTLLQRLSVVVDELLSALCGGEEALVAFDCSWSQLQEDISQVLDPEILSYAHTVSTSILALAGGFIDYECRAEGLAKSLHDDVDTLLSKLTIEDLTPSPSPSRSASRSVSPSNFHPMTPSSSSESSSDSEEDLLTSASTPPYIAPAYKWLLKNLHNPYPTVKERESFLRPKTTMKSINDWFIAMRQRIGWSKIVRTKFHGDQEAAIDGAIRTFYATEKDPETPYGVAFIEMKANAEDMYRDKFRNTSLASQMNIVIKNLSPEDMDKATLRKQLDQEEEKKEIREARAQRKRQRAEQIRKRKEAQMAIRSYPSPSASPEPHSESDSDDEQHSKLISLAGQKRRRFSSESADSDDFIVDKRQRTDSAYVIEYEHNLPTPPQTTMALPSPSTVYNYWASNSENTIALPKVPTVAAEPTPSRKRRLSTSDADFAAPLKRTRFDAPVRGYIGPRLHAVSDPLPASSAVWNSENSAPAVDAEKYDWENWFSQPLLTDDLLSKIPDNALEVEVFTGWDQFVVPQETVHDDLTPTTSTFNPPPTQEELKLIPAPVEPTTSEEAYNLELAYMQELNALPKHIPEFDFSSLASPQGLSVGTGNIGSSLFPNPGSILDNLHMFPYMHTLELI